MTEYQGWKLILIAFVCLIAFPVGCTVHANTQIARIAEKQHPIDATCAIASGNEKKEMCIIRAQIKP